MLRALKFIDQIYKTAANQLIFKIFHLIIETWIQIFTASL